MVNSHSRWLQIRRFSPSELFIWLLCWCTSRTMYRLRVIGREHLPSDGPAVLVCNHVSYVDWMIIASSCPRPVRFVMHHSFFALPLAGRIFKDAQVIPIASVFEDRGLLETAFDRIARALERNEIVCIFPEGRITTNGQIRRFRPGVELIVQRTPVPVIPLRLHGLWGSFFSKKHGKPMSKPFRRFWSRIALVIDKPISPEKATAAQLYSTINALDPSCAAQVSSLSATSTSCTGKTALRS